MAAAAVPTAKTGGAVDTLPNVIVVMSDSHRWDAMSFTRTPEAYTPHMKKLADEGVTFSNCFSTLPICTPFRAMVQTGRYPWQTGIIANHMDLADRIDGYASNGRVTGTIGQVFSDAGYKSIYVGKWHLGCQLDATRAGYHESYIWPGEDHANMTYTKNGSDLSEIVRKSDGGVYRGVPEIEGHPAYPDLPCKIIGETDLAVDLLQNHSFQDSPLFMILSLQEPHDPYTNMEPVRAPWDNPNGNAKGDINLPPHTISRFPEGAVPPVDGDETDNELGRRGYFASVSNVDDQLGRVMRVVQERGIGENTILIYCSDHGVMGEKLDECAYGQKRYPYDNAVRVPFIVRWPNGIDGGQKSDVLTGTVDYMPTICSLAGIPAILETLPKTQESRHYCATLPGNDLSPALLNKESSILPSSVFCCHLSNMNNGSKSVMVSRTVITREFTCSLKGTTRAGTRSAWEGFVNTGVAGWLLFDRQNDPYQKVNLADNADYAAIYDEHTLLLREWIGRTEATWIDRWFEKSGAGIIARWNREHDLPEEDRLAGLGVASEFVDHFFPQKVSLAQRRKGAKVLEFAAGTLRYTVHTPGFVALELVDVLGRRLLTLERGSRPAGTHTISTIRLDRLLRTGSPTKRFIRMKTGYMTHTLPLMTGL